MSQAVKPKSDQGGVLGKTVAQLEWLIFSGELQPGERFSEQALSLKLGVGRGPLREALRTLEGRRLIERTPFAGARVVELSTDDVAQILVMREALEGTAARYAAENITLPEIVRIRALLDSWRVEEQGLSSVFRWGNQEMDFHAGVARGSRNRWVEEFLCRDLYSLLRLCRARSATFRGRGVVARDEHYEILEVIEQRKPDQAEALMRAHIARGRQNLLDSLR